jgi:hypothetical protein
MQHSIQIKPIAHGTRDARFHLEHAVRADDKLGLVADPDAHLAGRHGAEARFASVGLELQRVARRDRVDAEGDVVADGDGLGGG